MRSSRCGRARGSGRKPWRSGELSIRAALDPRGRAAAGRSPRSAFEDEPARELEQRSRCGRSRRNLEDALEVPARDVAPRARAVQHVPHEAARQRGGQLAPAGAGEHPARRRRGSRRASASCRTSGSIHSDSLRCASARSPTALSQLRVEGLAETRQPVATQARARVGGIPVGGVLSPEQTPYLGESFDLGPRTPRAAAARCARPASAPGCRRAPLGPVPRSSRSRTVSAWSSSVWAVAMRSARARFGHLTERVVAQSARCLLEGGPGATRALLAQAPGRHRPRQRRDPQPERERADECLVGVGLGAAQPVVDVAQHEPDLELRGERVHAVGEHGRVDPRRRAHEQRAARAVERLERVGQPPEQRVALLLALS